MHGDFLISLMASDSCFWNWPRVGLNIRFLIRLYKLFSNLVSVSILDGTHSDLKP